MPTHSHFRATPSARAARWPTLTRGQMQCRVQVQSSNPLMKVPKTALPTSSSLCGRAGQPYNQGSIGSCTANSLMLSYDVLTRYLQPRLSRLDLYDEERLRETYGTPLTDSGADPNDGYAVFRDKGIVEETVWPYDVTKVDDIPNLKNAVRHKISASTRLNCPDLTALKTMIVRGYPVNLGISVYNSFMSQQVAQTGTVPLPNPKTQWDPNDPVDPYVGGHEVTALAYDDATQLITCLNSWGADWGNKGFFTLPYAYVTNPNLMLSQGAITGV